MPANAHRDQAPADDNVEARRPGEHDRQHKPQPVHPGSIKTGVAGEQMPAVLKGWLEHV
jgi:hypothetical protein